MKTFAWEGLLSKLFGMLAMFLSLVNGRDDEEIVEIAVMWDVQWFIDSRG